MMVSGKPVLMHEALEALVDQNSLTDVLYALAEMCHEKADHVRSNWQDAIAAKEWDTAGRRIGRTTDGIAKATHL